MVSDTLGEAEARRQGYAAGYDEASKRSGARIAELEAEVARLPSRVIERAKEVSHAAFHTGRRAALEEAAQVCDGAAMSADGDNSIEATIRATARTIRTSIRALAEQEAQG